MDLLSQKTLLYAEDNLVTQLLYEDYFKTYFKTVYTALDGKQALEIYQHKKPDIVVLDINMPLLSGLDVSKKIRKTDKETVIILLTARTDKTALLEAIELGLTTYLEKPVTKEQLQQALKKIADNFCKATKINLWHYNKQNYFWDTSKRELFSETRPIVLTKKEKHLLEVFITSKQDKVSYEYIYDTVWSDDDKDYSEASIKTLIKGLRAKLPPDAIKNVYGLGYFLNKSN